MTTRSLFDPPAPPALRSAFDSFHALNPHVLTRLIAMADQARAAGVRRFGMKRLFEILRWEHAIRTQGGEYLLNNNFTAFYSRLVMEQRPDLLGFFETRHSVADAESGAR